MTPDEVPETTPTTTFQPAASSKPPDSCFESRPSELVPLGPATDTALSTNPKTVDLNGDGHEDSLYLSSGKLVAEIAGKGFTNGIRPRFDLFVGALRVVDLDGDGNDEVLIGDDGPHWGVATIVHLVECQLKKVKPIQEASLLYSDGGEHCFPGGCWFWFACTETQSGQTLRYSSAAPVKSDDPAANTPDSVGYILLSDYHIELDSGELRVINEESRTVPFDSFSGEVFQIEANRDSIC